MTGEQPAGQSYAHDEHLSLYIFPALFMNRFEHMVSLNIDKRILDLSVPMFRRT